MAAEVYVRNVRVEQDQISLPEAGRREEDWPSVPGARRIVIEVGPAGSGPDYEAALTALVGQVVRMEPAPNAG
jgi:hypothetical protein